MPNDPINKTISPWMPERDPIKLAVIGKLGEEAAELAQRCFRIVIQGLNEKDPDSLRTNSEELAREISDVAACLYIIHDVLKINLIPDRQKQKIAGFKLWHEMIRNRKG